ncbi:GAF and ANTAR domain-containing protein [Streptomyces tauricus]|uniref:GAF and ANTAR domain-containing protein n=1 Tax=Streptomyces tauricus TaxID=68274 RepID=UPI0037F4E4EA
MTGSSKMMARILGDLSAGSSSSPLGADPAQCAHVLGVDGVAVSLGTNGTLPELMWSTAGRSALLEDAQFTLGEGPGLDAHRHRTLIVLPDLERGDTHRWPAFLPEAGRLGVRALFCLPLHVGGESLGVLTAQRSEPAPMDSVQMDDAFVLSAAITAALMRHDSWRDLFAGAEPQAVWHRAAVHQATGIISVQAGVSLTEAMVMLRSHAYRTEEPLLKTADAVVARRLHFRDNRDGTATEAGNRD